MILRNKKTGQIVMLTHHNFDSYHSLAEINEEWEDSKEPEEPEEHYFISNCGEVKPERGHSLYRNQRIEIGNDFETKEEAEKAVAKLKAWRRLKDKGFSFLCWSDDYTIDFLINGQNEEKICYDDPIIADLDLLFSGGEE